MRGMRRSGRWSNGKLRETAESPSPVRLRRREGIVLRRGCQRGEEVIHATHGGRDFGGSGKLVLAFLPAVGVIPGSTLIMRRDG